MKIETSTSTAAKTYQNKKIPFSDIWIYFILILVSFVCIAPFLFMFIASFKSMEDIMKYPMPLFETGFTTANFIEIFSKYQFARVTWNSFYVALFFTLTTIYISAMSGYALSKYNFKLKNVLFLITIGSLLIPFESTMIPMYIIFKNLGLVNKHLGLIIPQVSRVAFGAFFMRQYLSGISSELIESGRIDGCSEFGIFNRIILPILKPAFATLGIVFFMTSWNNYVWPLILLKSPSKMTIPIALKNFQQAGITALPPYHLLMAGAVVSILPMVIAFFGFQKYFIAGITDGAVKG